MINAKQRIHVFPMKSIIKRCVSSTNTAEHTENHMRMFVTLFTDRRANVDDKMCGWNILNHKLSLCREAVLWSVREVLCGCANFFHILVSIHTIELLSL